MTPQQQAKLDEIVSEACATIAGYPLVHKERHAIYLACEQWAKEENEQLRAEFALAKKAICGFIQEQKKLIQENQQLKAQLNLLRTAIDQADENQ